MLLTGIGRQQNTFCTVQNGDNISNFITATRSSVTALCFFLTHTHNIHAVILTPPGRRMLMLYHIARQPGIVCCVRKQTDGVIENREIYSFSKINLPANKGIEK